MGRQYRNPPLAEALCEFRFEAGQPWDWTVPGLVYREVQDRYPSKRQVGSLEFRLGGEAEAASPEPIGSIDRMQFYSEDGTALMQIGSDMLTVNRLKPYPGWSKFKVEIFLALEAYTKVAAPHAIKRIGLRYINRIDVPGKEIRIEDYLAATPSLPDVIPGSWAAFVTRVHAIYPGETRGLALTIGMTPPMERDSLSYILDLDLGTLEGKAPALGEIAPWIERAHEDLEAAFESSITDKTRLLFDEGVAG